MCRKICTCPGSSTLVRGKLDSFWSNKWEMIKKMWQEWVSHLLQFMPDTEAELWNRKVPWGSSTQMELQKTITQPAATFVSRRKGVVCGPGHSSLLYLCLSPEYWPCGRQSSWCSRRRWWHGFDHPAIITCPLPTKWSNCTSAVRQDAQRQLRSHSPIARFQPGIRCLQSRLHPFFVERMTVYHTIALISHDHLEWNRRHRIDYHRSDREGGEESILALPLDLERRRWSNLAGQREYIRNPQILSNMARYLC